MRGLFISTIDADNSGIFKKIQCQTQELSKVLGECDLLFFYKDKVILYTYINGQIKDKVNMSSIPDEVKSHRKRIYIMQNVAYTKVLEKEYSVIYFRDQYLSSYMMRILQYCRLKNVCSIMEIPTYPYYIEQFNVAPNKIKASLNLIVNYFNDILYSRMCTKIAVVKAKSSALMRKNMISIWNGVDNCNTLIYRELDESKIYIVGVAHIYSYHGFDRVINSIKEYYENGGNRLIEFHIIGDGPELVKLKKIVLSEDLEHNVFFEGVKTQNELQDFYAKANIAVGTCALYRRGADIDTAIKVPEALVRGIPIITSGNLAFEDKVNKMVFKISNSNDNFSISKMIDFLDEYNLDFAKLEEVSKIFNWNYIMKRLMN